MELEPQKNKFTEFAISPPILNALNKLNFTQPTEIQEHALPLLLGKTTDMIALAQTGSGKTIAFGIPLIEKIDPELKQTQGLILCPTRELAMQVSEQIKNLSQFKALTIATIYGGSSYRPQEMALKKGAHVIVATPGRLIDFLEQGLAKLDKINVLVLDEADEMISLGFHEALETILKHANSQSERWLFSATMGKAIRKLADNYLKKPQQIAINKSGGVPETVDQIYFTVKSMHKKEAISRLLQVHKEFYGIIFCQTKAEVAEIAEELNQRHFAVEAIHGDRTQQEREIVLRKFRSQAIRVLVATDVAARGLDIKNLTHVINHSLPWDVDSYIHRIGRTGRNGQPGVAFNLVSPDQVRKLARIQQSTGRLLKKGSIPTTQEVAFGSVEEIVGEILSADVDAVKLEQAVTLVKDILSHKKIELGDFKKEEILARAIVREMPKLFVRKEMDLDYMPGTTPREMLPPDKRRSLPPNRGVSSDRGGGYGRRAAAGDRDERSGERGGGYGRRAAAGDRDERGGEQRATSSGGHSGIRRKPKRRFGN